MNSTIQLIHNSIQASLDEICGQNITHEVRAKQNKLRSVAFLRALGVKLLDELKQSYDGHQIAVLSGSVRNPVFNRKEYLFDLHAFEYDFFESPFQHTQVPYIKRSLIQLESELEPSTSDVAADLSKLVCGNAPTKVMIVTQPPDTQPYLKSISPVASRITECLMLALLPHPRSWTSGNIERANSLVFENAFWVAIS